MTISEQSRHALFVQLESVLGQEAAATLMERLPPVGWADVATKRDLDQLHTLTQRDIALAVTIDEGTNRLVGRGPLAVVAAAREVLADPPLARRPELWDGRAGERIADVLLSGGTSATRLRPTALDAD